jgi:8-oxo-dGTP pyrophosphatase MutT (NUDIX family)
MAKLKKFTSLKPKDKFKEGKEDVLFSDKFIKVIKYEDWSIVKERDLVVCIPYLIDSNQIILRHEYVPTFKYVDGQEYHATLICGGIEVGETPEKAILRELEEEAGIVLREDFKLDAMKPLFVSKGCVDKYHPYILTLTERDFHEKIASGDGTKVEKMSKSVKVDVKYLGSINTSDLITDYMLLKLKEYLNL